MTDDITSPDGEATFEVYDWQHSLSAAVAAHAERQALRRNERAEFARRRTYGLARRYAQKSARNAAAAVSKPCQPSTDTQLTDPSPVGQTGTELPGTEG